MRSLPGLPATPTGASATCCARNRGDLSPKAFSKLWNTLIDLGDPGAKILKAWIAKDLLRTVLALACTGTDRSVIFHRLTKF